MAKRSLTAWLAKEVDIPSSMEIEVTGLACDSRQLCPDDVFIALPGEKHHGNRFIAQAIESGAAAVLTDTEVDPTQRLVWSRSVPIVVLPQLQRKLSRLVAEFYDQPACLKTIGITGTNGKTSVSYLLADMLSKFDQLTGLIGTLGAGIFPHVVPNGYTTPEPITLHREITHLAKEGASHLVMEVSSHALALHRVDQVNFEVGVFTNLSPEHLDFHGDMQHYGQAKARLFHELLPKSAVINVDDPFGQKLYQELKGKLPTLSFGFKEQADITARDLDFDTEGFSAHFVTPRGVFEAHVPLFGAFNVSNVLALVGVACQLGIDVSKLQQLLPRLAGAPGRLQWVEQRDAKPRVCVDYAHTPDALKQLLSALRRMQPRKIICVFGCGGERDKSKRALMGRIACELADFVIITNDNPRREAPHDIVQDICQGIQNMGQVEIVFDRRRAIMLALEKAGSEDIVAIAGKGHERLQQFSDHEIPFSDLDVAQTILAGHATSY